MSQLPIAVETIPVHVLLEAYAQGLFPMCHDDGGLYWHDPDPRAIFPLGSIGPNDRLRRVMRSSRWTVTRDEAFEQVIRACADRRSTWIDERIVRSYLALHVAGHAHSVEVWQEGQVVGGIYGVAMGAAFFGESMFSRVPNAGKVGFHHLVRHLEQSGYRLFDSQYINDFTRQLGAVEVSAAAFRRSLSRALCERTETSWSWSAIS